METTNQVILAVPVIFSLIGIIDIVLFHDSCHRYLEIFMLTYYFEIVVVLRPAMRSYYLIYYIKHIY